MPLMSIKGKSWVLALFLALMLLGFDLMTAARLAALRQQRAAAEHLRNTARKRLDSLQLAKRAQLDLKGWEGASPWATRILRAIERKPEEIILRELDMKRSCFPEFTDAAATNCTLALHNTLDLVLQEEDSGASLLTLPTYVETLRDLVGSDVSIERHKVDTEQGFTLLSCYGTNQNIWLLNKPLFVEPLGSQAKRDLAAK